MKTESPPQMDIRTKTKDGLELKLDPMTPIFAQDGAKVRFAKTEQGTVIAIVGKQWGRMVPA